MEVSSDSTPIRFKHTVGASGTPRLWRQGERQSRPARCR